MADDTIFALSSGAPPAAIAVVRVSGPAARDAAAQLAGAVPAPRLATLRKLVDPADGTMLDRALLLWFPAPASATGEDVLELHLHGGRAVVAAVLAALGRLPGCRAAEAGEFTRRAFYAGRIDLTAAEGLADLLAAETEAQRRQALAIAEGGLARRIDGWRQRLVAIAARIEAAIDFAEEDEVMHAADDVVPALEALADEVRAAIDQPPAERLRDGVRVVLAGPPNAGKSTLLNALAGRDAAIVSAEPGTTRDLIEVPIQLDGIPLVLIDSAGLRDGGGPIERIGIALTRTAMARADLVLWLGNPAEMPVDRLGIGVLAKADLCDRRPDRRQIAVSATTGFGMSALRQAIISRVTTLLPDELPFSLRHLAALQHIAVALDESVDDRQDIVVQADHCRHALAAFDRILGRDGLTDIIDTLFDRFCLGK